MSAKKSKRSKTLRKKRVSKVRPIPAPEAVQSNEVATQNTPPVQSQDNYPENQKPLPMPEVDKKTVESVEKLMEISYLGYMRELRKSDMKDNSINLDHLSSMLSEYVGPYMLLGYLPDGEPLEIMYAPQAKDREAMLERLRKTFVRHMNANSPGFM